MNIVMKRFAAVMFVATMVSGAALAMKPEDLKKHVALFNRDEKSLDAMFNAIEKTVCKAKKNSVTQDIATNVFDTIVGIFADLNKDKANKSFFKEEKVQQQVGTFLMHVGNALVSLC